MDTFVFAAVLLAAFAHAGWNAAIKGGLEPFAMTVLIAIGAGVLGLPLLVFFGLPAPPAWPWVAASVLIHLLYFAGLIESYRAGDLGQVYPIARGTAPLLTALTTATILGEELGLRGWLGIISIILGVFLLSRRGGRSLARLDRTAVAFALFTAVMICAYSVVDGIGARAAGSAHAYSVALFVGNALVMILYALVRRGTTIFRAMAPLWRKGLIGGGMQLGSYWTAIWAMTVAPIALVAALRETSVLFGALIAVVILKEPLRAARIVAACLIVSGLVMIRLH